MPIGIPLIVECPHSSSPRHLLFVGRLVLKTGCADLIEAVSGIPGASPVVIIGEGPLRGDLERFAQRLRVSATFVGAWDPGCVAEAMAESIAQCVRAQKAPTGDQEGLAWCGSTPQRCRVRQ